MVLQPPPQASHQGGVWERVIRSVRKILRALLGNQIVNDETLLTVMAEVEKILNDRPLTRLSEDPNDLEPLTPNHLCCLTVMHVLPLVTSPLRPQTSTKMLETSTIPE